MRLITTEIAKEKGFYAALNGVGLKANWWVGGNPYNNWGEEKQFFDSWEQGWHLAQT